MTDQSVQLSKKWLYGPFIVVGIILVAYYLLWSAGAAYMKRAVYDWIEVQRAEGLSVNHGAISADGFPFFLRAHIDEIDISSPDGWQWQGDRLSIDTLPYDLNRLVFSPRGKQILHANGFGEWHITAEDLRASIANDKERGWAFALTVGNARATRVEDGSTASVKSLVMDLAPEANMVTTLGLNLTISQLDILQHGEAVSVAQLQSIVSVSQTHLLTGNHPSQQWRNGDGEITITRFFADIEETKLKLAGDIHLDRNDYPAGQINADIQKPAGLARLLGKTGALSTRDAETAAAGLSLMAIASGGKITAPIKLIDGKALIGGVKIADLPIVE